MLVLLFWLFSQGLGFTHPALSRVPARSATVAFLANEVRTGACDCDASSHPENYSLAPAWHVPVTYDSRAGTGFAHDVSSGNTLYYDRTRIPIAGETGDGRGGERGVFGGFSGGFAAEEVTTAIGELRAAGLKDAHHVMQDAAVRDLPGYDTQLAPGVQVRR